LDMNDLPIFSFATKTFSIFDMWMSQGELHTFAIVINFMNETRVPNMDHIVVGFFEMNQTIEFSMIV
jgi:hypothetical protein